MPLLVGFQGVDCIGERANPLTKGLSGDDVACWSSGNAGRNYVGVGPKKNELIDSIDRATSCYRHRIPHRRSGADCEADCESARIGQTSRRQTCRHCGHGDRRNSRLRHRTCHHRGGLPSCPRQRSRCRASPRHYGGEIGCRARGDGVGAVASAALSAAVALAAAQSQAWAAAEPWASREPAHH